MSASLPTAEGLWPLCHVVSIPLVTPFRGVTQRETVIIEGPQGAGEWAAFPEYNDEEAAWWLAAALEQAFLPPPVALEGLPTTLPVNAIVPAIDAHSVGSWLERFPGVTSAKVKVGEPGHTIEDDISRVAAVRKALGTDATIRLDANGAWSVDHTIDIAERLSEFTIDYIEQPVFTLEEMRALKGPLQQLGVRLAADELVRKTHHIDSLLGGDVCDVVIVKPSPLGGNSHALLIAEKALNAGLEVVVSSGLETSVGLSHAAHLAAHINRLTRRTIAHGLATAVLLDGDTVTKPLLPHDGAVQVGGVTLDHGSLQRFEATPERQQWWRERLEHTLPRATRLLYKPE